LNKELPPSWNAKALIIEPGGFDTKIWRVESNNYPQPAAYSSPNTPTSLWRNMVANARTSATGDPAKAAKALIKLSHVPANQLPTRVQLGSDCWAIIKARAEATIRDAEKWSELSHSVNKDGVNKETVIKVMTSPIQKT
jgi:hypothetical protein